jgi:hypothetical protein
MGSSTGAVLPTIKSVADAQPRADDYRNPFAEALVGTLATGPEIATHGFNPGTAAYEVTANADAAVVRFDANGGGRAGFAYFEPAVLLRGYGVDDTRVSVEISSDGGNTFAPLAPSLYNLTTRDDEAELGADTRLFQYLGEIPGTATGSSAFAFRFSREAPECDDGLDNDGDGSIDLDDPLCDDAEDLSEAGICGDGLDNDGDGFTDFSGGDRGCADPDDSSENDPTLPCDDGIDNDRDGSIDFPSDPGCEDLLDETESPDPMEAEAKLQIRLRFNKPSKDKILVLIKNWQLPEGVVPTDVTVNVGGAECTGTLDAEGRYRSADKRDSIKVKQDKETQLWKIVVKRKKNDFAADLWDEGCTDSDNPKPGMPVTVPLIIEVGGVTHGQDVDLVYKSKQGKKGTAK